MVLKRALRSSARSPDRTATAPQRDGATNIPSIATRTSSQKSQAGKGADSLNMEHLAEIPSTPPAKRARLSPRSVKSKSTDKEPIPLVRPAGPHSTNAPLKTPRGSRLVAYTAETHDSSPSKTGVPRPTISTSQILDEACAHLIRADPRLQPLIEKNHCRLFSPEGLAEEVDPFQSLCSGIMAQQVSGAAANSIKNKFVALFPADEEDLQPTAKSLFPSPSQVAPCDVAFLRTAGLSARKAEYIKGLAEKFVNGELSAAMLVRASDEEILEKLTAVRGLGLWSVQMFACFALRRTDIFSTGDLGVQRGMAAFMGKNIQKLKANKGGKWKYMSEADMLQHSAKFAPYR
ncbi:MAG: hypothetical protein Q9183_000234 [Haloplaca sp. 2 TL-2023]